MSVPDLSIGSPYAHLNAYEMGLRPYDPPVPLYKYMKREDAEKVIDSGLIRLGSIVRYRDLDSRGEIRDDAEGLQRAIMLDADIPIENPFNFSEWVTFEPGVIANPSTNQLFVANSISNSGVENCFVLCLTPRRDAKLMKEFDPGYDCALLIDDPVGFFIILARHLSGEGTTHSPFLGQCSYDGLPTFKENISSKERVMPRALMKRPDHKHHNEVRMVFPTTAKTTGHWDATIPELRSYARLISP